MKNWHNYFRKTRTLCFNTKGATAIEVGLTILPFLLAMFAVAEFGWYYLHMHTLTAATRDGIRIGALGSSTADPNNPKKNLSREESVKHAIRARALTVMDIDPSQIYIFPLNDDFSNPKDVPGSNPDAGAAGAFMRVRVQYEHEFFTKLIGGFFSDSGSIQMITEGTYRNEEFIL